MKILVRAVLTASALALSAGFACAFDASLCFSGCNTERNGCYAKIDALNDMELRDQRAACDRSSSECTNRCDAERENELREQRERLAQQPQDQQPQEQPPQDQQEQQPQDQQEQPQQ